MGRQTTYQYHRVPQRVLQRRKTRPFRERQGEEIEHSTLIDESDSGLIVNLFHYGKGSCFTKDSGAGSPTIPETNAETTTESNKGTTLPGNTGGKDRGEGQHPNTGRRFAEGESEYQGYIEVTRSANPLEKKRPPAFCRKLFCFTSIHRGA